VKQPNALDGLRARHCARPAVESHGYAAGLASDLVSFSASLRYCSAIA
jgi:hypothetical protein